MRGDAAVEIRFPNSEKLAKLPGIVSQETSLVAYFF